MYDKLYYSKNQLEEEEEEIESNEDLKESIHDIIVSNSKVSNNDLKLQINYKSNILILVFCFSIYFIYIFLFQS